MSRAAPGGCLHVRADLVPQAGRYPAPASGPSSAQEVLSLFLLLSGEPAQCLQLLAVGELRAVNGLAQDVDGAS